MTLDVYRTSLQFPWYECRPLIQQLQSSALSVESNIMEGATRGGDIEFRRFSKIALSSACELEGQMLIARDLGYLDPDTYSRMNLLCEEVRKMLWGLILRLGGFQS